MSRKTYILVGLTGSGKSTTGNCIYNKTGALDAIQEHPFPTSDSSSSCTKSFNVATNDSLSIIDTIGFGDPTIDKVKSLDDFKTALSEVNFSVDCVLFLVRKGKFSQDVVEFFKTFQESVLKNKCVKNSILIVTNCETGWVEADEQRSNEFVKNILKNCNNLYYEFSLRFDRGDDTPQDKLNNIDKRANSIRALVNFLDEKSFEKIDISFVKSAEFTSEWQSKIVPALAAAAAALVIARRCLIM
jgi:hypothetical protein